jgi:hypothetical protein
MGEEIFPGTRLWQTDKNSGISLDPNRRISLLSPTLKKKALKQERPANIGVGRLLAMLPGGWRLVVFFGEKRAEDVREETHQRLHQILRELRHLLTQRVQD